MVTLSPEEMSSMSPAELKEHQAGEEKIVFGENFQRDKHGNPIEVGIGSAVRPSENHFKAIGKWEGPEAEKKARAEAAKLRGGK